MNLKDLNENLPINIPTNFHCQFFKSSIYDPTSYPPQSMALKSSKISSNYTPESIYLAMTSSNKMPSNTLENFIDKMPSNNKIENFIDLKPEKKFNFLCNFPNCNKIFKSEYHLKRHNNIHLKINEFICKFCQKSFNRSDNLKTHINKHKEIKDYRCNFNGCIASFSNKSSLNYHMLKHSKNSFNCNFPNCHKEFLREKDLITHCKRKKFHLKKLFNKKVLESDFSIKDEFFEKITELFELKEKIK